MIRDDVPSTVANRGSFVLENSVYLRGLSGKVVPLAHFLKAYSNMADELASAARETLPFGQEENQMMISVPDFESLTQVTFYSRKTDEELVEMQGQAEAEAAVDRENRYNTYLALKAEFENE